MAKVEVEQSVVKFSVELSVVEFQAILALVGGLNGVESKTEEFHNFYSFYQDLWQAAREHRIPAKFSVSTIGGGLKLKDMNG